MKRWLLSLFFFLSFTSLNKIVYSQEKTSQSDSEISEQSLPILQENATDNLNIPSHNFSSNIFWFIIFILFLSLVGFILLKILRNKNFSLNSSNLSNNPSLKILFEFPMGKNNSLKVIEFYSQIFLIAESSQGINLISKIEDCEICNQILIDYSTKASSEKSLLFTQRPFSSLLQSKIETVLGFSQKKNSKMEKELGELSYDDKKRKSFLKTLTNAFRRFNPFFPKVLLFIFFVLSSSSSYPQEKVLKNSSVVNFPFVNFQSINSGSETAFSLQLLLVLTVLSLAPSILVLMTSFLRISIVLDFVRRALSLQTTPPNSVIMGLSLFLSIFLMWPIFSKIYQEAYKPLSESKINFEEFYDRSLHPLRLFMYHQMENTKHKEIRFFMKAANLESPKTFSEVPTYVLVPAFVLHELTVAFKMGVLIMLPFIVIDLIVSTILMAMGMIMLPPVVISLPFKLLIFVLADGWSLISMGLMQSFKF